MEYLIVGEIVNAQGIKGELRVVPLTDDIERFHLLESLYVGNKEDKKEYKIENVRFHKQFVLLKLENIDDRTKAESFKKSYLYINKEDAITLEEDEYFLGDLIGLTILTEDGEEIGALEKIYQTGAHDIYGIKDEKSKGNELLLPATSDFIKKVDIENQEMIVYLMDGIRELKDEYKER